MWPYESIDIADLAARGWRPSPFQDFILKVHQRCNLACDYCYVYTMADQSWRDRPAVMPAQTWRVAAHRIAEHALAYGLTELRVVLHGGEPLLLKPQRLLSLVADVRAAIPAMCRVRVSMQTNGVLLDEARVRLFHEHRIEVGVSLDGTRADNDRHRRHRSGGSSYQQVSRALDLLRDPRYRSTFGGLLCTIDPGTDPVGCFEDFLTFEPPAIDYLFPHSNWAAPPYLPASNATAYADWLIAVFDRWYGAARQEVRVRLFEEIINLVLGGQSRSEQVGLSPVAVVVIETDGAIEQVDSLKSTYPGACETGLNVFADPLADALAHPGVVARQIGSAALSDVCRLCRIHRICGGGHYAHRFRPGVGFRNPSVYCRDMRRLIEHIQQRVEADLAQRSGAVHR